MARPRRKPSTSDRRVGAQTGALCWRMHAGKVRLLMVTSRRTGRWILPKGWMMKGFSAEDAAAIEAWEEAGVRGKVRKESIGRYRYIKEREKKKESDRKCEVEIFPLKVKDLEVHWPEMHQRRRRWMSRKKAAQYVWEPELSRIIKQFDPRRL